MTIQGVETKLGYRICDWIGQTLVEPLPHPHTSTWNINGFQVGGQGSSAIGDFTIPLYPPRSDEYSKYKREYDLVRLNGDHMRIEGYVLGPDGEYMFGIPVFSGIITKITFELDKFELAGFDTLWLAQQQVLYPGQSISFLNNGSSQIFQNFNRIESLLFYDDFNGHNYPPVHPDTNYGLGVQYTFPVGAAWTLVTDEGLKGYQVTGVAERIMLAQFSKSPATNLFLNNFLNGTSVVYSAWFHVTGKSTANGVACGVELIIGDDGTGQNHIMVRAWLTGNGTTYDIAAEVWSRQAGTYTQRASKSAFTGLSGDSRFQVIAIITVGSTNPVVRVLVNGKDTGSFFDFSGIGFSGGGNFYGFRFGPSAAETATITACSPCLKRRHLSTDNNANTPLSQPSPDGMPTPTPTFDWSGRQTGGTPLVMSVSGMTFLDLWGMAAALAGWTFRKHANRLSYNASNAFTNSNGGGDFFNWGSAGFFGKPDPNFSNIGGAGADLTKAIILKEGEEIISGGAAPNAESAASELKFGFGSAVDGAGQVTWPDPIGLTSLGRIPNSWQSPPMVISDIINISGALTFVAARAIAQSIAAKKSLFSQAKVFTINRTPDIATPRLDNFDLNLYDSNNYNRMFIALNPQAFAEQDLVMLLVPSLDMNMIPATIIGYTFRESDPTMDVIFDQHPFLSGNVSDRRRIGAIDLLMLKQGGGG